MFTSLEAALKSSRDSLYRDSRKRTIRFADEPVEIDEQVNEIVESVKSDWLDDYKQTQKRRREKISKGLSRIGKKKSS